MKTSNKLILVGLLVTLASLFAYDMMLKKEYLTGNYKTPFKNYDTLKWKDFDVVVLNASSVANVKLVQGPFNVRIDDNALDYVKISQQANRLQIDVNFENYYRGNPNAYLLVISCPLLKEVYAGATYTAGNSQVTDTIVREDWNMRQVSIDGFKQDTIHIVQDYGSTVVMENNVISSLRAITGKSNGSGSKIILRANNEFRDVDLDIDNKSKMELENAAITNLSYQLAPDAKLTVSGNAQHMLNKLNLQQK